MMDRNELQRQIGEAQSLIAKTQSRISQVEAQKAKDIAYYDGLVEKLNADIAEAEASRDKAEKAIKKLK